MSFNWLWLELLFSRKLLLRGWIGVYGHRFICGLGFSCRCLSREFHTAPSNGRARQISSYCIEGTRKQTNGRQQQR